MSKYTIKYEYIVYDSECPCCATSEQTLTIYENSRTDGAYMSSFDFNVWAENEENLRFHINDLFPEYNDFTVHEDTRWF